MNESSNTLPDSPQVVPPEEPPKRWDHLKTLANQNMAKVLRVPNIELKVIFMIHIVLTSLAGMGSWSASSYLFYNMFLLVALLWAIHTHSDIDEPVRVAISINAIGIFLDIILLTVRFLDTEFSGREKFFAIMGVIHLLVRPVSALYLATLLKKRARSTGLEHHFATTKPYGYDYMDKPRTPPHSQLYQVGCDFSRPQQI